MLHNDQLVKNANADHVRNVVNVLPGAAVKTVHQEKNGLHVHIQMSRIWILTVLKSVAPTKLNHGIW